MSQNKIQRVSYLAMSYLNNLSKLSIINIKLFQFIFMKYGNEIRTPVSERDEWIFS